MPPSGQRGSVRLLAAPREHDELSSMTTAPTPPREEIDAAAGGEGKRDYVRRVFEQIAPRYDLLNHLLSLNIDRRWRRQAIDALHWKRSPAGVFLDLCAGTLDAAAALVTADGFTGRVVAADFAEPMLRAGRGKVRAGTVWPVVADALRLPLADASIAGAIVAFGARNFAGLDDGLREARRVLQPGARLVVLEFTTPRSSLVRVVYHAYFHHLLPFMGGMISGHRTAYSYLPKSVAHFPRETELVERMERAGFTRVSFRSLTLGIAAIHVGER
jgi:demethylmenaquinone methyltransferase / 2-methoxy-6-polyprenyl-1,4-benzoquinol methylase